MNRRSVRLSTITRTEDSINVSGALKKQSSTKRMANDRSKKTGAMNSQKNDEHRRKIASSLPSHDYDAKMKDDNVYEKETLLDEWEVLDHIVVNLEKNPTPIYLDFHLNPQTALSLLCNSLSSKSEIRSEVIVLIEKLKEDENRNKSFNEKKQTEKENAILLASQNGVVSLRKAFVPYCQFQGEFTKTIRGTVGFPEDCKMSSNQESFDRRPSPFLFAEASENEVWKEAVHVVKDIHFSNAMFLGIKQYTPHELDNETNIERHTRALFLKPEVLNELIVPNITEKTVWSEIPPDCVMVAEDEEKIWLQHFDELKNTLSGSENEAILILSSNANNAKQVTVSLEFTAIHSRIVYFPLYLCVFRLNDSLESIAINGITGNIHPDHDINLLSVGWEFAKNVGSSLMGFLRKESPKTGKVSLLTTTELCELDNAAYECSSAYLVLPSSDSFLTYKTGLLVIRHSAKDHTEVKLTSIPRLFPTKMGSQYSLKPNETLTELYCGHWVIKIEGNSENIEIVDCFTTKPDDKLYKCVLKME